MLRRRQHYLDLAVILSVLFILMLAGWTERVHAQGKYPTRAIEMILPYAPGGATDIAARDIANYLRKKWGVPVNVVSKPGGRGIPALVDLYQAAPDGYTMLGEDSSSASMLAAATAGTKDLPFETLDRTFVATFKAHPFVIFVPSTSPFKTLKDFVAEAKKNTKDISYSAGPSALEYAIRQLFNAIGVDISKAKAVMCKGAAEAVILAAGGNVTIGAAAVSTTLPAIKSDTIRPLLISSKTRWPDLPNLPSSTELGYPDVDTVHWVGISGPPKLPANIAAMWDQAIQEMLKDPTVIAQMKNTGGISFYNNGPAMVSIVKRETAQAIKLFK
jgi:tripartite-type tricarboxylate transporter receptor subunit TctC